MDKVVVLASECLGEGDRDLGVKLTGLFLTKLRMQDKLPDAVVFYNSGVRLLAEESTVRDSIEGLSEDGVEILACGTCVKHYGLGESTLAGRVSGMQEIVGVLLGARSVVRV